MRIQRSFGLACSAALAFASLAAASAQAPATAPAAATPLKEPLGAIPLPVPKGSVTAAQGPERWITYNGEPRLTNVTQPTITPFLPARGKGTGAAVIIAPGGGFFQLPMDKEGWNAARWLADHGVAAFVLKYRLISRSQTGSVATALAARPAGAPTATGRVQTFGTGVEDAQAAMRLVRGRAAQWGIDPRRIGMMGFSAGATLTLAMATESDATLRPDFIAPIYAPAGKIDVPADAPPMFTAVAADDGLFAKHGFGLAEAWHEAGRPVELHVYEKGGHGFGVPGAAGTTTTGMMDQLLLWLRSRGLLDRAARP